RKFYSCSSYLQMEAIDIEGEIYPPRIIEEAAEKYGSDLFPSPFLKRVISRGGIFRQPRLETYIYVLR
ncbi:MAG: hypothetical protein QGI11_17080, partial [Nitrospinota bacterium]|nr:hypothetical protein [Nitrospinota bacterium]